MQYLQPLDRCLPFKKIVIYSGKLPPDAIPGGLSAEQCMLGMEFSGVRSDGQRVMGLVPAQVLFLYHSLSSRYLLVVGNTCNTQQVEKT